MIRRAVALLTILATMIVLLTWGRGPATHAAALSVGRVHHGFQPHVGKTFIAVIGSDARFGNPDRVRADAIHIVGINPRTMRGGVLNFPRDAWVSIPGWGSAKLNEALYAGGPELVAKTLENITGIKIDYWAVTGFEGFKGIIDDLGGVKIHVPGDVYDPYGSGAHIDAGTQNLGAEEALAYVRTRHSFPNGDIDRSTNQGRFLLAMLRKLHRQVRFDPASLLRWISVARRHTRLDLEVGEMLTLGVLASKVKAGDVSNVTVPVSLGMVGAASVVFISPEAKSLYSRFKRTGSL